MQKSDIQAVQRLASDLKEVGISEFHIETRPIANNGDRIRALLNFETGKIEIITVNGEKDPVKIERYSRILTFDALTGKTQGTELYFKKVSELTPEERDFMLAADEARGVLIA